MKISAKGFEWAYRDFLTMMFIVFLAFAVLAVIKPKPMPNQPNAGTLFITLNWDLKSDSDLDLWLQSPDDSGPVGFIRKAGRTCNLVKDDLGRSDDPNSNNSEMIICRAIPDGQWLVNVVVFNNYSTQFPIPVKVGVFQLSSDGSTEIAEADTQMEYQQQEKTVLKFTMQKGVIQSVSTDNPTTYLWIRK